MRLGCNRKRRTHRLLSRPPDACTDNIVDREEGQVNAHRELTVGARRVAQQKHVALSLGSRDVADELAAGVPAEQHGKPYEQYQQQLGERQAERREGVVDGPDDALRPVVEIV